MKKKKSGEVIIAVIAVINIMYFSICLTDVNQIKISNYCRSCSNYYNVFLYLLNGRQLDKKKWKTSLDSAMTSSGSDSIELI